MLVFCSLSNSILNASAAIYGINSNLQTDSALQQTANPLIETDLTAQGSSTGYSTIYIYKQPYNIQKQDHKTQVRGTNNKI